MRKLIGVAIVAVVITGGVVFAVSRSGSDDDAAQDEARQDGASQCERTADPEWSIARHWNEAVLAAIRNDFPAPTVHARNLFHSSAGMWDAWAAYDSEAAGVFVDEEVGAELDAGQVAAAREEAMSYAAYRILVERYLPSPEAEEAVTQLDDLMDTLCYDRSVTTIDGDSPAALGNRIAETILVAGLTDGSNEANAYVDPDYQPVNPPLIVDQSGTVMNDPNRWQPLELEVMVAQNGQPLDETVQSFVGPHWGDVTPFALPVSGDVALPLDPGAPPMLGDPATDQEFKEAINDVIRFSATLDPSDETTIEISPASLGNATVGTYGGEGRGMNPVTGSSYEENVVALADYGRVIAEFWADGPASETPPGHWDSIANTVSDELAALGPLRIGGEGADVDRLEWDTKLYLALNGAAHDAAVAAWGIKGEYDYVRPISMIRYLGDLGQSSDPDQSSYDPDGLLLESGLVEVITESSSAAGERHEALADHVGEIAVFAWSGAPDNPEADVAGVDWILAVD
ncbi:MAG: hypothetical protein DRJ50_06675, partial [Actinobacteria bacterium]